MLQSSILNYRFSTLYVHMQFDTDKITNFENHFQNALSLGNIKPL